MTENNLQNLFGDVMKNIEPKIIEFQSNDGVNGKAALVPKGMDIVSVQKFIEEGRLKPSMRQGCSSMDTLASFIALVNRFKTPQTAIFTSMEVGQSSCEGSATAIFDYHPAGANLADAGWLRHKAEYTFPLSLDFKFWLSRNGSKNTMSQDDFAMLLEERINDMVSATEEDIFLISELKPNFASPIEILSLSRSLEIYSQESVVNTTSLSSGEKEIKFTSVHTDASGNRLKVPDFFMISIPLFVGASPIKIPVRLRYRKKDSQIVWYYELYRIDRSLIDAYSKACEHITSLTEVPLFEGDPENPKEFK